MQIYLILVRGFYCNQPRLEEDRNNNEKNEIEPEMEVQFYVILNSVLRFAGQKIYDQLLREDKEM